MLGKHLVQSAQGQGRATIHQGRRPGAAAAEARRAAGRVSWTCVAALMPVFSVTPGCRLVRPPSRGSNRWVAEVADDVDHDAVPHQLEGVASLAVAGRKCRAGP